MFKNFVDLFWVDQIEFPSGARTLADRNLTKKMDFGPQAIFF